MKRKIYSQLVEWKQTEKGKSALLIEGARRIGKSYIVEEFARNEYDSYILIDFNHTDVEVIALFENYATRLYALPDVVASLQRTTEEAQVTDYL